MSGVNGSPELLPTSHRQIDDSISCYCNGCTGSCTGYYSHYINWKTGTAHALNAISAVGMVALAPFLGYISIQAYALVTGALALLGVAGSFIKQEVEDYEDDLKDHRVDEDAK